MRTASAERGLGTLGFPRGLVWICPGTSNASLFGLPIWVGPIPQRTVFPSADKGLAAGILGVGVEGRLEGSVSSAPKFTSSVFSTEPSP